MGRALARKRMGKTEATKADRERQNHQAPQGQSMSSKPSRMAKKAGVAGALIMAFMLIFRDREEVRRPKIVWVDRQRG